MTCTWEKGCVLWFTCYSMLVGPAIGILCLVLTKRPSGRCCVPASQGGGSSPCWSPPPVWLSSPWGEGLSPFPFLSHSGSSLVLQVKFTCCLFPHLLRLLLQKGMEVPVGFAPPAVSAHPLHLHHGWLSQEPPSLVGEHPVESVQKKPVIVCGPPVPMPCGGLIMGYYLLLRHQFASPAAEAPPSAWMPPVKLSQVLYLTSCWHMPLSSALQLAQEKRWTCCLCHFGFFFFFFMLL